MIMDWMNRKFGMGNLVLSPIFEEVKKMASTFNSICSFHFYRKLNSKVGSLSKQGLQLVATYWMMRETKDGIVVNERILQLFFL